MKAIWTRRLSFALVIKTICSRGIDGELLAPAETHYVLQRSARILRTVGLLTRGVRCHAIQRHTERYCHGSFRDFPIFVGLLETSTVDFTMRTFLDKLETQKGRKHSVLPSDLPQSSQRRIQRTTVFTT